MATITPSWTENVSLRAAATLAAGASDTADIDLADGGYDLVEVQVNIAIGSASSVTVEFFKSVDSGGTDDDQPAIAYTVTADDIRTIPLSGAYAAVKITNDDGSNATGNISALYAGRKWTSA